MTRNFGKRVLITGLASLSIVAAGRTALANTVQFEAEAALVRSPFVDPSMKASITSPLMIMDDAAASAGSYITVAAGNNSPSSAPTSTTEGVAKYTFSVAGSGTYRIWARVIAPTTADDSFWIRIGSSSAWINWNGMPLGSAWHWVQVKANGATSAATFNLTAGIDNELQVAYREDGAKLDAFIITDSTSFNPAAAITGPPAPPVLQPGTAGGGSTKVTWSFVPGATSYTVERSDTQSCPAPGVPGCCVDQFHVLASGIAGYQFTDVGSPGGPYRVTAVGPTGSSPHKAEDPMSCMIMGDPSFGFVQGGQFDWRAEPPVGSQTAPMKVFTDINGGMGAPAGTNSTSAVPAHGRIRLDFELAAPVTMRLWATILAPSTSQDSFWVRWDDGAWINWNGLGTTGCDTLHDSSKSGSPAVKQPLGAGSHRIEFAYREGGARLENPIRIIEDSLSQSDLCSD